MSFSQETSTPSLSQIEDSVSSTSRCEQGLLGLANATRVLLCHSNLSAAFPRALEHARAALQINRLYICEHKGVGFSLKYEALDRQSTSRLSDQQWQVKSYEDQGLAHWLSAFRNRHSIGSSDLGFSEKEQQFLGPAAERFNWLTPIYVLNGELWGFLGCEHQHPLPHFGSCEQPLLLSLADNLGCAISRQREEQQMQYQAFHDLLTGLPNRMLFHDQLTLAIAHARRAQEMIAVMFLDLDKFKQINDTRGHEYGDQILIQASQRLQICLREEDILARWGGDEFTLCLPNLKSSDDVVKIGQRLLSVLRHPFQVKGESLEISGSLGIALYPQDGETIKTLLRNADVALYRVKKQGKDHYQFFQPKMNSRATEQQAWTQALLKAISNQPVGTSLNQKVKSELEIYYQPLMRLGEQGYQIYALEALLCWHHPEQGLLTTSDFLPRVEPTGLVADLGQWTITSVVAQLRDWQAVGIELEFVSLNLSGQQLRSPKILTQLSDTSLRNPSIPLMIGLGQAEAEQDLDYFQEIFTDLKSNGIGLILQEFGFNSVAVKTLIQLPISQLKLERQLLGEQLLRRPPKESPKSTEQAQEDGGHHPSSQHLTAALLAFAQQLRLPVVAEGVDSQMQLDMLQDLNCSEVQGNFLSPPLKCQDVTALLQRLT